MEDSQELVPIGTQKDEQNQMMIKGKRAKRQRPQSPILFTLATNSSPIRGSGDDYYITGQNNINPNSFSTDISAEVYQDSTEEEDDMANCLILLAQGRCSGQLNPPKQLDEDAKFINRRYLEAATGTGEGKAGYYVYECKTCGRSFPSFQALGGHRASHRKPKNMAAEERRQLMLLTSDDNEDTQSHLPYLSLQSSDRRLYNNNNTNNNNKSSKSHECSICGAEFTSGQALGGHMRRHRGYVNTTARKALSLTSMSSDPEELRVPKRTRNVLSLDLDLNLPAPDNDHSHRGLNFPAASNQQQKRKTQLVLSSPTLVDCPY